jgi:Tfp pilus assembly protein PilF
LGRFAQARDELQLACELDPLSLVIHTTVGPQFSHQQHYDLAIKTFQKVLALDEHFGLAQFFSFRLI